jgi:hypothetical protein
LARTEAGRRSRPVARVPAARTQGGECAQSSSEDSGGAPVTSGAMDNGPVSSNTTTAPSPTLAIIKRAVAHTAGGFPFTEPLGLSSPPAWLPTGPRALSERADGGRTLSIRRGPFRLVRFPLRGQA